MNECGIYLLPEGIQQVDARWPVLAWSSQGELRRACLDEVADQLGARSVVLVLPMELLSDCTVAPVPGRRPSREALAYAVEEQLAASLDTLHLAFGAVDEQGSRRALVIDRALFQRVLAVVQTAGLNPLHVHVDADRLFGTQAGALYLEGRWLLGGAGGPRLAVRSQAAQVLAQQLPPMAWMAERCDAQNAPCNQRVDSAVGLLMQGQANAVDLLQGCFRKRRRSLPWQALMAGALLASLIICAGEYMRAGGLQRQASQLQADNLHAFQAWAPEQSPGTDLLAQIQALEPRPLPVTAMQRLAELAEHLVDAGNLRIERAVLEPSKGWRVEVVAQGFADLERLQERVPEVDMGHARQVEGHVRASLHWAGSE
ncbi:type II secretion system protein GspL [Pseudomonas sp. Teo4]|uniref:type II secretion system protein GspL n=1 Tax=Pseudomonas sp. Teo4 TaxID=3064528 RepID=UPI002ABA5C25|nr:type II secretion system protein GspL [Pseudomonas sp. Teo4]MDZ3994215.1 hypothetical protein [Pseudomonas sp. Teo4]